VSLAAELTVTLLKSKWHSIHVRLGLGLAIVLPLVKFSRKAPIIKPSGLILGVATDQDC
jgi:hypothetical protein